MIIDTSITKMELNMEFSKEEETHEERQHESWDAFLSSGKRWWKGDYVLTNNPVNSTIISSDDNGFTLGTYGDFTGGPIFLNNNVFSNVGTGIIVDSNEISDNIISGNTFSSHPMSGGAISFDI